MLKILLALPRKPKSLATFIILNLVFYLMVDYGTFSHAFIIHNTGHYSFDFNLEVIKHERRYHLVPVYALSAMSLYSLWGKVLIDRR
jgi:hypothetical protein